MNYWIQPIYQELLHASSRRNATRECERKRPSSGLAREQRMPNHPNCGGHRLLARASGTGLEVPVRLIPYRFALGPSGVATAAEEGGHMPSRAPVVDG